MKEYKFRLSETSYILTNEEIIKNSTSVKFIDDDGFGKVITVKRDFDGKCYQIIVPLDMLEERK